MLKRTAILLGGILMGTMAIGAGSQDLSVTASSIHVDRSLTITTLIGNVVVKLPADAVITIAADNISLHQATGETLLEGRARLTLQGAELTADRAIVRRGRDGAMEVNSEQMRIAKVASL